MAEVYLMTLLDSGGDSPAGFWVTRPFGGDGESGKTEIHAIVESEPLMARKQHSTESSMQTDSFAHGTVLKAQLC